jgi:hypothetical protein
MSAVTINRARPATAVVVPEIALRMVSALLALAVSVVHVADQGGVTALNSPTWIGWSFRLIEAGGVLTAIALLVPRTRWLGWAAGVLLGVGPFIGYLASRSIGLPGDPHDVGNWGYWVGTVSLFVEAALIVLSLGMLWSLRRVGGARPV